MSRDATGILSRYVDTTSPLTWPRSRRTAYRNIRNLGESTGYLDSGSFFRKWTIEGANACYEEINRGLLNDDLYTLQKHAYYINELHRAIRANLSWESIKVYRGLKLELSEVNQIKTNMAFLWPTFSSTSRNKSIAQTFGSYIFEIDASPNDGTYRADINNYSAYSEQEVLFYPYSGFRVKNIFKDARVIQLECMDTVNVEALAKQSEIPGIYLPVHYPHLNLDVPATRPSTPAQSSSIKNPCSDCRARDVVYYASINRGPGFSSIMIRTPARVSLGYYVSSPTDYYARAHGYSYVRCNCVCHS